MLDGDTIIAASEAHSLSWCVVSDKDIALIPLPDRQGISVAKLDEKPQMARAGV